VHGQHWPAKHPFDGDGQIHTIRLQDGKGPYRNPLCPHRRFEAEQAGQAPLLWSGHLWARPSDSKDGAPIAASRTAGSPMSWSMPVRILSTLIYSMRRRLSAFDRRTTRNLGTAIGYPQGRHFPPIRKSNEATGEIIVFSIFDQSALNSPLCVVGPDNRLKSISFRSHCRDPRLPHDMRSTRISMFSTNCPLYWKKICSTGAAHPRLASDQPTRFGHHSRAWGNRNEI